MAETKIMPELANIRREKSPRPLRMGLRAQRPIVEWPAAKARTVMCAPMIGRNADPASNHSS